MKIPFRSKGGSKTARKMHFHMNASPEVKRILTSYSARLKGHGPEDLSLLYHSDGWLLIKLPSGNRWQSGEAVYSRASVVKIRGDFPIGAGAETVWQGEVGKKLTDNEIAKLVVEILRSMD
jgi:hypothetical protein